MLFVLRIESEPDKVDQRTVEMPNEGSAMRLAVSKFEELLSGDDTADYVRRIELRSDQGRLICVLSWK